MQHHHTKIDIFFFFFLPPRRRLEAQLPPAVSARLAMVGTTTPRSPQCPSALQQTLPVRAGACGSRSLPAGRSCAWGTLLVLWGSQAGLQKQFLEGIAPEGKSERRGDAGALGSEGGVARGHPCATGTRTWQRRAAPHGAAYAAPKSRLPTPSCYASAAEQTCQINCF